MAVSALVRAGEAVAAGVRSTVIFDSCYLPDDTAPFLKDRAVLLRGLSWLQGEEVHLPGAGEAKHF